MQKKRILAALLSAAMVVTSAAVPVFAEELDEAAPDEVEAVEAADDAIELTEEYSWTGNGTEVDPYQITDEADLKALESFDTTNTFFKLTSDIELTEPWTAKIDFKGTLDGSDGETNHTITVDISGLGYSSNSCALFYYNKGTIKNLTVKGAVKIQNLSYQDGSSSGIVKNNSGIIENCVNYCDVEVINANLSGRNGVGAGGIAAVNNKGTITGCKNYGKILCTTTGTSTVHFTGGGIAGTNYGTIEACENYGNVYVGQENKCGFLFIGGIAGSNGYNSSPSGFGGKINDCNNYGDVESYASLSGGEHNVGGIAGRHVGEQETVIKGCLNVGSVTTTAAGSQIRTGGIAGIMGAYTRLAITDNKNAGKVTAAEGTYYGAIVGNAPEPSTWGSTSGKIEGNTYLEGTSDAPYHYSPRNGFTVTAPTPEMLEAEKANVKPVSFEEMDKSGTGEGSLFEPAEKVEVKLAGGAGGVYDIVLSGVGGTKINRFMSAELNFNFAQTEGSVGFEVVPNEDLHINMIRPENPAEDGVSGVYEFNLDGSKKEAAEGAEAEYNADITDLNITLGKIVLTGHGKGTITVERTGSIVNTAEAEDNIVDHYTAEGGDAATLILPETTNGEVSLEMGDIQVYVMFPNKIERNAASEYNQMKVTIDSAVFDGESITVDLGTVSDNIKIPETLITSGLASGGNFSITREQTLFEGTEKHQCYSFYVRVPANFSYTLTFSGEGYRTYSVDTVAKPGRVSGNNCTTVYVWNNAMDDPEAVVTYMDDDTPHTEHMVKTAADGTTFLAGDIVEDRDINLYDLSAVVAYFGKDGLYEDDLVEHKYVKYDLNRDGQVDSKDIAMVLVSWGK